MSFPRCSDCVNRFRKGGCLYDGDCNFIPVVKPHQHSTFYGIGDHSINSVKAEREFAFFTDGTPVPVNRLEVSLEAGQPHLIIVKDSDIMTLMTSVNYDIDYSRFLLQKINEVETEEKKGEEKTEENNSEVGEFNLGDWIEDIILTISSDFKVDATRACQHFTRAFWKKSEAIPIIV